MPNVKKSESKDSYIERCMKYPESVIRFPNKSQRYAICESKFKQSKK